jgi:hypothetical protein
MLCRELLVTRSGFPFIAVRASALQVLERISATRCEGHDMVNAGAQSDMA